MYIFSPKDGESNKVEDMYGFSTASKHDNLVIPPLCLFAQHKNLCYYLDDGVVYADVDFDDDGGGLFPSFLFLPRFDRPDFC